MLRHAHPVNRRAARTDNRDRLRPDRLRERAADVKTERSILHLLELLRIRRIRAGDDFNAAERDAVQLFIKHGGVRGFHNLACEFLADSADSG